MTAPAPATIDAARGRPTRDRASTRPGDPAAEAPRLSIRLFDADRSDRALELEDALSRKLGERQLLWIDIEGVPDAATAEAIAERMGLKPITARLLEGRPAGSHVAIHGSYFHVRVATEASDDATEHPRWLDLVASDVIVVSRHLEPIELLNRLDERIETDATIGELDAPAFVATAIDSAVTSYFQAVDAIEEDVDRLDSLALTARGDEDVLSQLVAVRRRIARLRRVLSAQREVFAAFATPDFRSVVAGDDADAFQAVAARFESALQSVENSRELLLGSFDVFMTRTAQRTNDTMKVLALATVLLLPGSLLAGLLGMNVLVPLPKDDPLSFWLVAGSIAVLAAAVLLAARSRRWI